jgi:DNA (cytosine-5)-methyltransferase 1
VEREAYACAVLAERMETNDMDAAPIWTDLSTFPVQVFRGRCDLVIAGLPCQPYSVSGKKLGDKDERYIWPAFFDLVAGVRPAMVFLENVTGLLRFFEPIGQRLSEMGYEIEAGIFSAEEVGAPHRRERFFVLAHSTELYWRGEFQPGESPENRRGELTGNSKPNVADAASERWRGRSNADASASEREIQFERSCGLLVDSSGEGLEGNELGRTCDCNRHRQPAHGSTAESGEIPVWPPGPADREAWERVIAVRPDLAPAIDGKLNPRFVGWLMGLPEGWIEIPGAARVDQLRALGNAVIPATAELAFRTLWDNKEGEMEWLWNYK